MINYFTHYISKMASDPPELPTMDRFSSLEEFLAIPRIKYISNRPDFVKFSVTPLSFEWREFAPNNYMIFAHYSDGAKWVIGFTFDLIEGL